MNVIRYWVRPEYRANRPMKSPKTSLNLCVAIHLRIERRKGGSGSDIPSRLPIEIPAGCVCRAGFVQQLCTDRDPIPAGRRNLSIRQSASLLILLWIYLRFWHKKLPALNGFHDSPDKLSFRYTWQSLPGFGFYIFWIPDVRRNHRYL